MSAATEADPARHIRCDPGSQRRAVRLPSTRKGDMARGTLGIIALIVLIAIVVYFVMEERDNELEIDIGTRDVPVSVLGAAR